MIESFHFLPSSQSAAEQSEAGFRGSEIKPTQISVCGGVL